MGKMTSIVRESKRRNAVIEDEETQNPIKLSPRTRRSRKMNRRAATTGNIEYLAATHSKQVKIVVMGAPGTGKTALLVRFMTKRFISEYPSIEMRYNHFSFVDSEIAYFDLLDTSYQNAMNCSTLYENKIKWGDAFIILYDINDIQSFDEGDSDSLFNIISSYSSEIATN